MSSLPRCNPSPAWRADRKAKAVDVEFLCFCVTSASTGTLPVFHVSAGGAMRRNIITAYVRIALHPAVFMFPRFALYRETILEQKTMNKREQGREYRVQVMKAMSRLG